MAAIRKFVHGISRANSLKSASLTHLRRSSFVVGARKLTFGKKTDLETLTKAMKLERRENFKNSFPSAPCVELLANTCEDMDYNMIRPRQPLFLHHRVDLLLQRCRYMQPFNITPRQKRKMFERHPPVFAINFTPGDYAVNYLRGLIHRGGGSQSGGDYVHLLYKCLPKMRSYVFQIEENLKSVCAELGVTERAALKLAVNMPCFLLWNPDQETAKFRVLHKDYGLPNRYDLDLHTSLVFPPVLKSTFKIDYKLLTNKPNLEQANSLPFFKLSDILEYNFENERGQPEDLSQFLIHNARAEGANENADLY